MARVSVIVPAYNNPEQLTFCLSALSAAAIPGAEIIVADDASTDETPDVARHMGARLVRMERNSGPAAARNRGAAAASGEILFFVDADVVVPADAVKRVVQTFDLHPEVAAVFGSYDANPREKGLISQYRNLLHHYVHQTGDVQASTFWAGCGAIRRSAFAATGGFDAARYPRPSIEDIELGYRLRRAGHRILLDKSLQATHLKRWTLWSMIRTDVTCRAIPWTRLLLETGDAVTDLNLKRRERLCGAAVFGAAGLLPAGLWQSDLWIVAAVLISIVGIMNRHLYAFFARQGGWSFAAGCVPLHLLYYLYSVLSFAYVWAGFRLRDYSAHSASPAQ